nr:hypothetical protein [Tanacetum cinerariifolium]
EQRVWYIRNPDSFIALMDENTVYLWLKDHQDAMEKLAQQQAVTFQAMFDTLRAELQATRRLLKNRREAGVIKALPQGSTYHQLEFPLKLFWRSRAVLSLSLICEIFLVVSGTISGPINCPSLISAHRIDERHLLQYKASNGSEWYARSDHRSKDGRSYSCLTGFLVPPTSTARIVT